MELPYNSKHTLDVYAKANVYNAKGVPSKNDVLYDGQGTKVSVYVE